MNVLVLGSGGREHALSWKIDQSSLCEKLFIAPGNAGTALLGENVNISVTDFESLKTFVIENEIEMLVVGPEDPLVKGIYDFFKNDEVLSEVCVIKSRLLEFDCSTIELNGVNILTFYDTSTKRRFSKSNFVATNSKCFAWFLEDTI